MIVNDVDFKNIILQSLLNWNVKNNVAIKVAENITLAHLYNHGTHGIQLMPRYKQWLQNKILSTDDNLDLENSFGNYSIYNANKIFGHYALSNVLNASIKKSNLSTVETFSIKNVGHLGYLKGILSTHNTNQHVIFLMINTAASKLVAPFNGSNKKMSTSCIAFLTPGNYCADFTLPSTSENEVRYLLQQNKDLTSPIMVNGYLSKNPQDLYDQHNNPLVSAASILFDNHKLFNMAIFAEIICGILSGSGTSQSNNFNSGCFGMVISTKNLPNGQSFIDNVQKYLEYIDETNVHIPTINNNIRSIELLDFEYQCLENLKENLNVTS